MEIRQRMGILSKGLVAVVSLSLIYFLIVSTISGFAFAFAQFGIYRYFLVSLAGGFGIQVGLYTYLIRFKFFG